MNLTCILTKINLCTFEMSFKQALWTYEGRDVSASIRELEKIEIVKCHDQEYKLAYALTKKQKTIRNAFGVNETDIKNEVKQLVVILKKY